MTKKVSFALCKACHKKYNIKEKNQGGNEWRIQWWITKLPVGFLGFNL